MRSDLTAVDLASQWRAVWQSASVVNIKISSLILLFGFQASTFVVPIRHRILLPTFTNGVWPQRIDANVAICRQWTTAYRLLLSASRFTDGDCIGFILPMIAWLCGCKTLQLNHAPNEMNLSGSITNEKLDYFTMQTNSLKKFIYGSFVIYAT